MPDVSSAKQRGISSQRCRQPVVPSPELLGPTHLPQAATWGLTWRAHMSTGRDLSLWLDDNTLIRRAGFQNHLAKEVEMI